MKKKRFNCPAEMTLSLIDGKWKAVVLWNIRKGPLRFGELKRRSPGVTQTVLTKTLRELEDNKILKRRVVSQDPLHVEYELSERGESLMPILKSLVKWGLVHQREYAIGEFGMLAIAKG